MTQTARADADRARAEATRLLDEARAEVAVLAQRRDDITAQLAQLSGVIDALAVPEDQARAGQPSDGHDDASWVDAGDGPAERAHEDLEQSFQHETGLAHDPDQFAPDPFTRDELDPEQVSPEDSDPYTLPHRITTIDTEGRR